MRACVRAYAFVSVCLSVCASLRTVNCIVINVKLNTMVDFLLLLYLSVK